jgi:hypothetical protein
MIESIENYFLQTDIFDHLILIDEVDEDEKKMSEVNKDFYYKINPDELILN